ncbi:hypothetical protein DVA67_031070 [Solirubrobacter sp. CPCC 204708]|uniref:Uncharacterized protein n=1 Tax=Solirubrobacter deserti TaxID=2282478 RepID=A0ABT4RLQ9_9ACTN|nr:hypothetical protein [Solirubrobacter deserti]MBE2320446.1 hypothetical protein [Solirubrobacter deserti]MDA0139363.1 hypothetical protein [Solirubrobacter deserti]
MTDSLEHTQLVALDCGAVLRTGAGLSESVGVGVLPTALEITETLLRASAHREAVAEIGRYGCWLTVRVAANMAADEWRRKAVRVHSRLRGFDGQMRVEPAHGGSRITVSLLVT